MNLNEAIEVSRKCLYGSPHYLERQGITEKVKDEAYSLLSEYHGRIGLLYKNKGTTEAVLSALNTVGD